MRRRDFLTGLAVIGSGITTARLSNAQVPRKMMRVGIATIQPRTGPLWTAFEQRLKELGYTEGEKLAVEFIDLNGPISSESEAMKELVRRKAEILIASGTEIALKSAMAATDKLPIVMIAIDYDPLASHYIANLARPGGNVTGVFFQQVELAMKRLQLMRDVLPSVEAATVFWDANSVEQWQATQRAGTTLGLRLAGIELKERPYDYEAALAKAAPDYRGALIVMTSTGFFFDRERIANIARRHRIPSIFAFRQWADAGGLLSYGPSIAAMYRLAADYVDRIARGAKPADLPVEQPTKFEFAINLKTAKALGLDVPPSLLARADEVIE
ncbi:MAG: ABC transporter substrate-binding protein [Xanthobacteraceae bacterium]